jgi:hypothetical protein
MSTAYYSTVLDHPVEMAWALIRDFNSYPAYIEGVTESVIEDNRRGDEVGAVRRFRFHDDWNRQRLDPHSDELRLLTYVGLDPFTFPTSHSHEAPAPVRYKGTMHLQGGLTWLKDPRLRDPIAIATRLFLTST